MTGESGQGGERSLYFVHGVVMSETDTHQAAMIRQPQLIHDADGVEVTVTDKNSLFTQTFGNLPWLPTFEREAIGRRAAMRVGRVTLSVQT